MLLRPGTQTAINDMAFQVARVLGLPLEKRDPESKHPRFHLGYLSTRRYFEKYGYRVGKNHTFEHIEPFCSTHDRPWGDRRILHRQVRIRTEIPVLNQLVGALGVPHSYGFVVQYQGRCPPESPRDGPSSDSVLREIQLLVVGRSLCDSLRSCGCPMAVEGTLESNCLLLCGRQRHSPRFQLRNRPPCNLQPHEFCLYTGSASPTARRMADLLSGACARARDRPQASSHAPALSRTQVRHGQPMVLSDGAAMALPHSESPWSIWPVTRLLPRECLSQCQGSGDGHPVTPPML